MGLIVTSALVCLFLFFSNVDCKGQDIAYMDSAVATLDRNEFDQSIEWFFKAENHYTEIKNKRQLALTYKGLGKLYGKLGEYSKAEQYLFKAENVLVNTDGSERELGKVHNNLGIVMYLQERYDTALFYHRKSLAIKHKLEDSAEFVFSYNNIALCYRYLEKVDSSLAMYRKALLLSKNWNSTDEVASVLNNIGSIYYDAQEFDSALYYYQRSVEHSYLTNNLYLKRRLHLYISKCWENQSQPDSALHYYKLYKKLNDEIISAEAKEKITRLEANHELKTLKQERALEAEQSRVRTLWLSLVAIIFIALVVITFLWQRKRIQVTRVKAEAYENTIQFNKLISKEIADDLFHTIGNNLAAIRIYLKSGDIDKANEGLKDNIAEVNMIADRLREDGYQKQFRDEHEQGSAG